MGHRRPLLLCLVVLLSIPAAALGQAFPPPEEAAKLSKGEPPREVGPILAVGLGWGGATTIEDAKGGNLAAQFNAGKYFHGLAGLRIEQVGLAMIYRQGTPGVASGACPGGGCDGKSKQVGGLVMFTNGADPGPLFNLGLGWWTDQVEIQRNGALVQRLDGWALFEYGAVEFPVGPPTSRFRLGGFFILAISNYDKRTTPPAGPIKIPVAVAQPIWGEIGLRASFF